MNINRSNRINKLERQRSPAIGPAGVQGFCLDVLDISGASDFFSSLGLVRRDAGNAWAVPGDPHACITLTTGPSKRLRRLIFSCPDHEIAALRSRAIRAGYVPLDHAGDDLVLVGPDQLEIELTALMSPLSQGPECALSLVRAPSRSAAPKAYPLALSHLAIFVSDVELALAFYVEVVGLRLSDRCGSTLAFLHGPHGSGHHLLALVKSDGPGLHHYSFEMGTIDAIGIRAASMAERGYAAGWGMGRHVLGSNFFHYVRDPWGSHAELTTGLDFIAEDTDWIAHDHPAQDAFYLWGPPPPPGFIDNPETRSPEKSAAA